MRPVPPSSLEVTGIGPQNTPKLHKNQAITHSLTKSQKSASLFSISYKLNFFQVLYSHAITHSQGGGVPPRPHHAAIPPSNISFSFNDLRKSTPDIPFVFNLLRNLWGEGGDMHLQKANVWLLPSAVPTLPAGAWSPWRPSAAAGRHSSASGQDARFLRPESLVGADPACPERSRRERAERVEGPPRACDHSEPSVECSTAYDDR